MLIWKITGQIYLVVNVNFLSPKHMKEQCPKAIGSLSSRMIGNFISLSFSSRLYLMSRNNLLNKIRVIFLVKCDFFLYVKLSLTFSLTNCTQSLSTHKNETSISVFWSNVFQIPESPSWALSVHSEAVELGDFALPCWHRQQDRAAMISQRKWISEGSRDTPACCLLITVQLPGQGCDPGQPLIVTHLHGSPRSWPFICIPLSRQKFNWSLNLIFLSFEEQA